MCTVSGDIIALGEHTLFILSTTGIIKASKLLDFDAISLCVYSKFGVVPPSKLVLLPRLLISFLLFSGFTDEPGNSQ